MQELLHVFAYIAGWLVISVGLLASRPKWTCFGNIILMLGLLAQFVWLYTMMVTSEFSGPADLRASFQLLGFICVLFFLIASRFAKIAVIGLVMPAFAVFLIMLGDSMTGFAFVRRVFEGGDETLHAGLLYGHILTVLAAFLAFTFSFLFAAFFLLQERRIRAKSLNLGTHFLPSLSFSSKYAYISVLAGFILYTVGLTLGFGTSEALLVDQARLTARVILPLTVWWLYGILVIERIIFPQKTRMLLWHNILSYGLCIAGLFYEIFFLASIS